MKNGVRLLDIVKINKTLMKAIPLSEPIKTLNSIMFTETYDIFQNNFPGKTFQIHGFNENNWHI